MANDAVSDELARALALHQAGRFSEAEALYRRVLARQPQQPDAMHLLGVLAHQTGRVAIALQLIAQALQLRPQSPSYRFNFGNALRAAARPAEAAEQYRLADQLAGGYPDALNNLGDVLRDLGKLKESVAACRKAIALNGEFALAFNNLGTALREMGQFPEAEQSFRRAIALKPDFASAYSNLGACLQQQGQLEPAVEAYRTALRLDPTLALTWNNLGFAFVQQGRIDEAMEASLEAVRLAPASVEAHNGLANTLKQQGRVEEAVSELRATLTLDSANRAVWSNLLHTLHYRAAVDPISLLQEHLEWHRRCIAPVVTKHQPHPNDHDRDRRLRIGYVSPDLRFHPVGLFLQPLLELHDRQRLEVILYSDVLIEDGITEKLRRDAEQWRRVVGLADQELAALIRHDQVDILVDLALHTTGNRLFAFAHKPAPIQVTFLGYPSTTGLSAMDYRFTDAYLDPPGNETFYTEQSLPLAGGYFCLTPHPAAPDVGPLAASSNGYITFGSLNNFMKVSQAARELWRELLAAVPNSRLLLHAFPGSHCQRVRDEFAAAGIDPHRIDFAGRQLPAAYFATYNRIDIALDSFPFAGGTTTCDALWMGVPVVTLAGTNAVQREGVSILSHAGLSSLIAHNKPEYVRLAVELTRDVDALASMRAQMRSNLRRSALMDARSYVLGVEAAYREIWRRWCERKTPASDPRA